MPALDPNSTPAVTGSGLRIIVTAPPHCGKAWLTEALAGAYGLDRLAGMRRPVGRRRGACRRRADAAFPAGSIYATRSAYSRKLVDRWGSQPVHIVTVLRDPYDLFAELEQGQDSPLLAAAGSAAAWRGEMASPGGPGAASAGDLLLVRLEKLLRRTVRWSLDERVVSVRYEDLRDDPVRALAGIAACIQPLDSAALEAALRACAPARLRDFTPPDLPAPSDALRLGDLDEIRWRCADDISLLGYAIR